MMSEEKNTQESSYENEGGASHTHSASTGSDDQLRACEKERDEYLNGWKRAKADLLNYKKEEAKRFEDIARFAHQGLIRDLLRVLDSFDMGESVFRKDHDVEKGVLLIRSQFMDILKRQGVCEIEVRSGDMFDPNIHEAIVEVDSDKPPGAVVEIAERGYMFHGNILRPAKVTIAKEKKSS